MKNMIFCYRLFKIYAGLLNDMFRIPLISKNNIRDRFNQYSQKKQPLRYISKTFARRILKEGFFSKAVQKRSFKSGPFGSQTLITFIIIITNT